MFPLIPLPIKEATGLNEKMVSIALGAFPLIPLPIKEATRSVRALQ